MAWRGRGLPSAYGSDQSPRIGFRFEEYPVLPVVGESGSGEATRHHVLMGYPNATRLNSLLSQICMERGWCIDPTEERRVRQVIPDGADAVVDTLIAIELEIEPILCDTDTRRWLHRKVVDWLFDPHGRGASSDLPL